MRMGLDYVDIFYHHRMDPQTPLEETMGALDQAVKKRESPVRLLFQLRWSHDAESIGHPAGAALSFSDQPEPATLSLTEP